IVGYGEVVRHSDIALDAKSGAADRDDLHLAAGLGQGKGASAQSIIVVEDEKGGGVADDGAAGVGIGAVHSQVARALIEQVARAGEVAAAGEDVISAGINRNRSGAEIVAR